MGAKEAAEAVFSVVVLWNVHITGCVNVCKDVIIKKKKFHAPKMSSI